MNDFSALVRLADDLYARFEAQGNLSDLTLSIVNYRSALTVARSTTDLSNDARSKLFGNLANVLSIRFQCHGDMADLDHSIECHLAAVDLRPQGHPGRANTLSNFATALLVRYGQLGVQNDIELAIEHFNTALPMLPPEDRLVSQMNYASALFSRFQRTGNVSDLNDAIHQYRAVVEACGSENKATSYYNLANALLSRYKLGSDPTDLELCIEYSATALDGIKPGHMDHPLILSCLSTALIRRFESHGHAMDLETAIEHFQSSLNLCSTGESPQYTLSSDLANALVMRYKLRSDLPDLELAIQHYRTSLKILPSGSKDEGLILDNLGNALFLRLTRLGELKDLGEAIEKHLLALELHSRDSPRRIVTYQALATCLGVRFDLIGDPADLRAAISLYNKALIETSEDHPQRAALLHSTATCLETRFRLYGGTTDLNRSISYCHEALELFPFGHIDQGACYYSLASSLFLRFGEEGDEFDLDQAYLHCSTSMNMPYASNTSRAACDLLFARILKARLLPWGDVKDIESMFHHLRSAKDSCTLAHPLISDVYAELASVYYLRFLLDQRPSDLKEAFGHHELSLSVASGPSSPAFRASLQWIRDVETYDHCSGLDAYRTALRLAHRHVLTTRSPELKQCFVRRYVGSLSFGAASLALRFNEPIEALEALEGGRSILWDQLVRAMTSLDDLRLAGKHAASLADDFERPSFQLEHMPKVLLKSSKDIKPLLREREAVVEQIRRVEGFKSFLKPLTISEFDKAAIDGPVIVVNAGQEACDAIIVRYNAPLIHIPLTQITPRDVSCMAARFRELTEHVTASEVQREALEHLLSELWDLVVYPIVQHLMPRTPRGSRLWWCPTGKFTSIPLHAAGPYKIGEPSLSHVYVSSYTPTLQTLIRARAGSSSSDAPRIRRTSSFVSGLFKSKKSKPIPPTSPMPTIVAIGHTVADDTCHDLDLLRHRIPPGAPFRRLEGDEVTSEAMLNAFREPAWLHLASPASLDPSLPFRSGFATKDGKLTMHDISKARVQAEFAFVSRLGNRGEGNGDGDATAALDEAMHFAASLQYSGVRSVVGTLWPVEEGAMRRVSSAFYEDIIPKAGGAMNHTNTARSLNEALRAVEQEVPLAQRIAFVHIGA